MNDAIKKAIKLAEETVNESKVDSKFISSAYEVVLAYLLQTNESVGKQPIIDSEFPSQQSQLVTTPSDWPSIIKQKKPTSLYQIIALVVDYLETQKSGNQQDEPFVSIKEIETFLGKECVSHIEDKDFSEFRQRIRATSSTYKFIKSKKRGFYVLSPLGRKMISRLPEQQKKS